MIYTYRPVFIHITTHSRIKVCTRVHLTGEYTDYHLFDRIWCEILTYFDWKQALCDIITYWWGTWFWMHEGTGASPWTGQYFRTAERRTWLPERICDILSLILFGHVIVDHLLRSNAICTRMYGIMEDLDLRPRYFSVKDTTMIPRW